VLLVQTLVEILSGKDKVLAYLGFLTLADIGPFELGKGNIDIFVIRIPRIFQILLDALPSAVLCVLFRI
jgi:hypothetical protein